MESATMTKVRRRDFEQRLHEFLDAVEYITDRPLLLWSPKLDEITKALVKAVRKVRERQTRFSDQA
jgi:hypothetical protein